jgi:hypothetical protein
LLRGRSDVLYDPPPPVFSGIKYLFSLAYRQCSAVKSSKQRSCLQNRPG